MRKFHLILLLMLITAIGHTRILAKPQEKKVESKSIKFFDLRGHFFLKGRMETGNQTLGSSNVQEQLTRFEEGVELSTDGYIYHPNLLDFTTMLRLGASQGQHSAGGGGSVDNGVLTGLDFSGMLFKKKRVSARIFAGQSQSVRDQDFGASTEMFDMRLGAEMMVKGDFPISLLVENIMRQETSERYTEDEQTMHARFIIADRRNTDWFTELIIDHEDTQETRSITSGPGLDREMPDQISEVKLSNRWWFGSGEGQEKHSLTGGIEIRDRQGFIPHQKTYVHERLNLNHTKTFSSFYYVSIGAEEFQPPDVGTAPVAPDTETERIEYTNAEIGLRKEFYDSLDITLKAEVSERTFLDGYENRAGVSFDAGYRKDTAIGDYSSSLHLSRTNFDGQNSGFVPTRDEAVTLNGFVFSPLSQPDIDTTTIVVTDAAQSPYSPLTDYTVDTTGGVVRISRTLGTTTIANGETVLVDYMATTPRTTDYPSDTFRWTNRLGLDRYPLTLRFDLSSRTEYGIPRDLVVLPSGGEGQVLGQAVTWLAGVDWTWKNWSATFEHEMAELLISRPYTVDLLRINYHRALRHDLDLTVGAHASRTQYGQSTQSPGITTANSNYLNMTGAHLDLNAKLSRNALMRFKSELMIQEGLDNRTTFRNGVSLEWNYGKLEFTTEVRYDMFEHGTQGVTGGNMNSGNRATALFEVRRRF